MQKNRSSLRHSKTVTSLLGSKQKSAVGGRVGFQTLLKARNGHEILARVPSLDGLGNVPAPRETMQNPPETGPGQVMERAKAAADKISRDMQQESPKQMGLELGRPKDKKLVPCQDPRAKTESSPSKVPQLDRKAQQLSLDELERKVQQLLQLKIESKNKQASLKGLSMQSDNLEEELEQLITKLRDVEGRRETQPADLDAEIKDINQRITIVERIMAESYTESEILKKYYLMKKLNKRVPKAVASPLNRSWVVQPNKYAEEYKPPALNLISSQQGDFARPEPGAYVEELKNNKIYVPNRQKLGMSSYETQYLNYGSLPVFISKQPSSYSPMGLKAAQEKSTYQTDFSKKVIKLEDSKLLNCREDKFKLSNISFMPRKAQQCKENSHHLTRSLMQQAQDFTQHKSCNMNSSVTLFNSYHREMNPGPRQDWQNQFGMRTEYGESFLGERNILESIGKESSLSNLKYLYRKKAHV